jgi:hypothetical protein
VKIPNSSHEPTEVRIIPFKDLRPLITLCCSHDERSRTHLSHKDTPIPHPVTPPGDGAAWRSRRSAPSIIGANGAA